MPNDLEKVQAGDLIEASLYNDLVDRIRSLESRIEGTPGDLVTVPDLIYIDLGTAVSKLKQPNVRVQRGPILDVTGATVDPDLGENKPRTVVGQTPEPSRRVKAGTAIQLLVAAPVSSGDGGGGTPPPKIDGFDPSSQNIGELVKISGNNLSGNTVTVQIDGEMATIEKIRDVELDVRIPSSVSEPPEGGSRPVPVKVTVDGQSDTVASDANQNFSVEPPKPNPQPNITGVSDNPATVGTTLVIFGKNFVDDREKITVTFDTAGGDVDAPIERAETKENADDEIEITVPDVGVTQSSKQFDFRVNIADAPRSQPFQSLYIKPSTS